MKTFKLQFSIGFFLLVAVFFSGVLFVSQRNSVKADEEHISCQAYKDANINPQTLFDSNPTRYARLDRDKDGLVCE